MLLNRSVRETWLHRVNPSFKLLLLLMLFLVVLFTDRINFLLNLTAVSLLLYVLATGHPPRTLLLLLLPVLLLLISSSTSMMFFGKGETTWVKWGLVHITRESFFRGLHVGLKSVNFALLGLLLLLTTQPVRLFYSLMQQCRLPAKYAYSFMAAIRLLPMMLEEFQIRRDALKVRGFQSGRGPKGMFRRLRAYAIPLLAQSIRRAQRIAVAMEAKRFTSGGSRTYYYVIGFSAADAGFLLFWAAGTAAAYWLGIRHPYI